MVKINFLMPKQLFLSLTEQKKKKKGKLPKNIKKYGLFYFVLLVTEKVVLASKIDFKQGTACGAPVGWSK